MLADREGAAPGRRRAKLAAQAVLGLGVSAAAAYVALRETHPDAVWEAVTEADVALLAASLAVLLGAFWLRAVRFVWVLSPRSRAAVGVPCAFWTAALGMLANTTLPIRMGDLVRGLAVSRESGVSRVESLSAIVVERAFDVFALAVLMLASAPFVPEDAVVGAVLVLSAGLVAAALVVVMLLRLLPRARVRSWVRRLVGRLPDAYQERAGTAVGHALAGAYAVQHLRPAVRVIGLTLASWLALGASTWLCIRAFVPDPPIGAGLLTVVFVNLAMVLPSTAAALGVFEVAGKSALLAYGVDASTAVSIALALHALNIVPFIPLGLVGLARLRRRADRSCDPGDPRRGLDAGSASG